MGKGISCQQELQVDRTKSKAVRNVRKISSIEFDLLCSNQDTREKMRTDVTSGDIFIVKNAVDLTRAKNILQNILSQKYSPPASSARIIEGVQNIYFTSNHTKSKNGEYTSFDNSWYFFPWNPDECGVLAFFQPLFDKVILLNNYVPEIIRGNTPKNGFVQRMHLINYPLDYGEISLHLDPTNVVRVNSGVYLTEYGEDYSEGGFYVLDEHSNKVNVDKEVSAGDLVLFYPGLAHGVCPVKGGNSKDGASYNGRFFLNMTLVESHERSDKETALGID